MKSASEADTMADMANQSSWEGVENNMEDPEEIRVIFCALDSFE